MHARQRRTTAAPAGRADKVHAAPGPLHTAWPRAGHQVPMILAPHEAAWMHGNVCALWVVLRVRRRRLEDI